MAEHDESYERAIAKLLRDHIERGVPDDADIWPTVSERLGERESLSASAGKEEAHSWWRGVTDIMLGSGAPKVESRAGQRRYPRLAFALGIVGLALLTLITAVAIGRFAQRDRVSNLAPIPTSSPAIPTPIKASSVLANGDYTDITPLIIGNPPVGERTNPFGVIAVGDDGNLWFANHLRAYNAIDEYRIDGTLLNTIKLDAQIKQSPFTDRQGSFDGMVVQGSNFWLLGGDTVYKATMNGGLAAEYHPFPVPFGAVAQPPPIFGLPLRVAENSQMLIELGDGSYLQADQDASMDPTKPQPTSFSGYPAGGKLYSYGNSPNEIMAGDVPVTIDVPGTMTDKHVLKVLPDGSFYVLVQVQAFNTPNTVDGAYTYVMHYAADGKLIERARLFSPYGAQPKVGQIALGPDGAAYAVASDLIDTGRIDLVRLIFQPASKPLPPVPTNVPTPILPTEIPTIEMKVPSPLPTGPGSAFASWTPGPTATPQPTPIADLATLAGKAEVIAHVQLQSMEPWNGEVLPFGAKILEWIKRPSDLVNNSLNVDEFLGVNGEIKVASALREIPDMGEGEFIVFLNNDSIRWGNLQNFDFTDPISGVYRISNGKIDYAGISTYKGWTVDQFKAALRPLVPTPEPVEQSVQDLVELGSQSTIAEVQLDPSVWQQGETLPDGRVLVMAKVVNWLRKAGSVDQEFVGLMATPEESARLESGSSHFILFVSPFSSDNGCEDLRFSGYYQIQQQPSGIFEIRDKVIGYAGIQGIMGWSVAKLEATLSRYVQAPQTDALDNGPVDVAGDTINSVMVAEVEMGTPQKVVVPTIAADGSFSPGNAEPVTFKVRKWLKKPGNFTGDSITVAIDSDDACRMSGKNDYYVIFLFQKTPFPKGSPLEGAYEPFGGYYGLYGIRDTTVVFGGKAKYWGWPVDQFESEIQGFVQNNPPLKATPATK